MWTLIPDTQGNYDDLNPIRLGYTYLHGKLQADCGYDCYGFINCELPLNPENHYYIDDSKLDNGKYPCVYNNKECTLYFWHNSSNRPHILVVYNDDLDSVLYAEKKLKEKPICN